MRGGSRRVRCRSGKVPWPVSAPARQAPSAGPGGELAGLGLVVLGGIHVEKEQISL